MVPGLLKACHSADDGGVEQGFVGTVAGFKYHLYADNFKFYIKTQSEPLSSEPIHPCADIPWTSWLTSDKRPPDSALGLSGLLMAEVPPWISSQLSLLQAAFLPAAFGCGLHHHLWMITLCSSAEVSALQSHTAAAKESDELGMTFAFPSSLPGLPRQQERKPGFLPWLARLLPLLSVFHTLPWSSSPEHTSASGPLHLWLPGLGMFLP